MSSSTAPEVLRPRLNDAARAWWDESLSVAGQSDTAFYARWSSAGRKLGRGTVKLSPEEREHLGLVAGLLDGRQLDEAGRALLLVAALGARRDAERLPFVEELYRTGELRERQAIVRALAWLPEPSRYVTVAVEAVRGNVTSMLEAIGCDNPYPANHLDDAMFNQMIVKMLFNELPLGRVVGLDGRRTPELTRMVRAMVSERRAAGRPVPADADLVTRGEPDAPV